MTETITVNAVDRSGVIERKDVEWAESAYLGEIGQGRLVILDSAGTITVPGFKAISVTQDASTPSRIFTGYAGAKRIGRGERFTSTSGREYEVSTYDLNDLLTRKILRAAAGMTAADGGKRPAETVGARITWLLAVPTVSALIADRGAVTYPTDIGMDATDYRGQYPGDVLAACAKAVRFNYYVRYHASGPELVFRNDNSSTDDTSTVTITNDGTANGTSSFAPFQEAELSSDPTHVYSGAYGTYSKGSVFAERAATATAYADRDGTTEDSGAKTSATATRDATTFLWESHTEEQMVSLTLRMRAAYVGLVQAGQRISTNLTHMATEGWSPAIYARILRKRVTQPLNTDNDYDVQLDLSPQEAGPSAAAIVQSAFGGAAGGGGTLSLPNPVTIGNLLVFCIGDRDGLNPIAPNTDSARPRWGATSWTKKPNSTAADGPGGTGNIGDGVAIWYKTADTVEQTGYTGATNAIIGIYEISGADIASATTVYKDQQVAATTMDIGSLGSPVANSVNIMVGLWFDETQYNTGTGMDQPDPSYVPRTGWTLDTFDASYHGRPILWNAPLIYIAHKIGDATATTAGGTRSALQNDDGRWGGAAISIPPL